MVKRKTLFFTSLLVLSACQETQTGAFSIPTGPDSLRKKQITRIFPSGKLVDASLMEEVFEKVPIQKLDFPVIDTWLVHALDDQLRLLQLRPQTGVHQVGSLRISPEQLKTTILILKSLQQTRPFDLQNYLEAHQIWGADRKGNVQFTGYFTPLIPVSKKKSAPYLYPIYKRPLDWEGRLPSRQEIEGGKVLEGLGLELAFARNKVDVYYMQVQGSGYVAYRDGKKELFSYNGTNRYPYRSIEKFIMEREDISPSNLSIAGIRKYLNSNPHLVDTVLYQNPSYTFFTPKKAPPTGAGQVPLRADYSIAVDKRYLPLGSCLLAAVPIYDQRKMRVVGHEYRILLAQDVGGVIKGPGHIDYYCGVGEEAQKRAGRTNHYGRIWLLLPKRPTATLTQAH